MKRSLLILLLILGGFSFYSPSPAYATTHNYYVNDTDAQGWAGNSSDGTFSSDTHEFTAGEYTSISADDSNYVLDSVIGSTGYKQYHHLTFTISENVADITQVNITWKGYGYQSGDCSAYGHSLWVKESGTWTKKTSGTSSSKETLTAQYTSNFSNIISSGTMHIAAQSDYNANKWCSSNIYSYYTQVVVTYTAPSNNAPTNDSLTFTNPYTGGSNNAVADNTTEWNFRAVVSDTDGYANLGTVVLRLANSSDNTTPFDSLKFTWTESTDTFSETADTQSAAAITSTNADSTCATNTCTLDFKIKFNTSFSTQSTNYGAELYTTDDAAATDEDSYATFYQVVPISISITSPADVSLGTITGTGTSSTGEATWTITTNNPAGYKLEWQVSSATMANQYSDTIAAYTPAVADTPETWSVAASDSEWGGRLKSTSTDYASGTWGADDTTNAKWLNVKSPAVFQIASRASTTAGSNEIVQFKAEIGSTKFQPTGTYTVNVTVTATTL